MRDWPFLRFVNLNYNYSSCSLTKRLRVPREKLELIIDNRDFITYFSRDFQFLDLRKINKDYESANETIIVKLTYTYLTWLSLSILPRYFVDIGRLFQSAKELIAQIKDHCHCKHSRANGWYVSSWMRSILRPGRGGGGYCHIWAI